ncbi:hypothetical protein Lal_00041586 [Lupinus albus]|nr:hypothetical protein Lal_00041586 [Lupinus albus]
MDSLISSILLLMFTCIVIQVLRSFFKKENYKLPPGPSLLTILGNLHEFWKKPPQTMANLANIYGPIMCFKEGYSTSVIISSPELAKEVLKTHDLLFSDRMIPQYQSWDPRLSERFSPGRERLTWEGEILGYTGEFSLERELSRLGEKWHFGIVETVRFSLEREGQI